MLDSGADTVRDGGGRHDCHARVPAGHDALPVGFVGSMAERLLAARREMDALAPGVENIEAFLCDAFWCGALRAELEAWDGASDEVWSDGQDT